MLLFLLSCFSFLFLSQSFLEPFSTSMSKWKFWSFASLFCSIFVTFFTGRRFFTSSLRIPRLIPSINKIVSSKTEIFEEKREISLLDLPDLALDCILDRLSPAELVSVAGVCCFLRERCTSDHLWERHFNQKWGRVMGESASREWQSFVTWNRTCIFLADRTTRRRRFGLFSVIFLKFQRKQRRSRLTSSVHENSIMSAYLALETGKFWFPAQVFNRENGRVGFVLSCYDAKLCYDSTSDNFVARYPSHGRNVMEEKVSWDRVRAAISDTCSNTLHKSSCLDELKPGDHIEVQWRKNKVFPFGWWYAVVGHVDNCYTDQFNCQCHRNEMVMLEFKQYSEESRWRRRVVSRKSHGEAGNDADGFYGGIIKVCQKDEIEKWRQLWPNCTIQ